MVFPRKNWSILALAILAIFSLAPPAQANFCQDWFANRLGRQRIPPPPLAAHPGWLESSGFLPEMPVRLKDGTECRVLEITGDTIKTAMPVSLVDEFQRLPEGRTLVKGAKNAHVIERRGDKFFLYPKIVTESNFAFDVYRNEFSSAKTREIFERSSNHLEWRTADNNQYFLPMPPEEFDAKGLAERLNVGGEEYSVYSNQKNSPAIYKVEKKEILLLESKNLQDLPPPGKALDPKEFQKIFPHAPGDMRESQTLVGEKEKWLVVGYDPQTQLVELEKPEIKTWKRDELNIKKAYGEEIKAGNVITVDYEKFEVRAVNTPAGTTNVILWRPVRHKMPLSQLLYLKEKGGGRNHRFAGELTETKNQSLRLVKAS